MHLSLFKESATPGFSQVCQWLQAHQEFFDHWPFFLACEWKTAWSLLYKPISADERVKIDEIVKVNLNEGRLRSQFSNAVCNL